MQEVYVIALVNESFRDSLLREIGTRHVETGGLYYMGTRIVFEMWETALEKVSPRHSHPCSRPCTCDRREASTHGRHGRHDTPLTPPTPCAQAMKVSCGWGNVMAKNEKLLDSTESEIDRVHVDIIATGQHNIDAVAEALGARAQGSQRE